MQNERLRRAMFLAGLDADALAARVGASVKSVQRWLAGSSTPYPRMRLAIAIALHAEESHLWPWAADRAALAAAELLAVYPRRGDVPRDLWTDLLAGAQRNVDVLAFAGLFLAEEHPRWSQLLREKATAGVRIRMLVGDLAGRELAARDIEHSIGGGVAGRTRAVLGHYAPLADVIEIRLHDTPLYNSIYRFDDDLLVNNHVYGLLAAYTPVMRLRRIDGAFFNTYLESYERVWAGARDFQPDPIP